jgi:hypothetical protein
MTLLRSNRTFSSPTRSYLERFCSDIGLRIAFVRAKPTEHYLQSDHKTYPALVQLAEALEAGPVGFELLDVLRSRYQREGNGAHLVGADPAIAEGAKIAASLIRSAAEETARHKAAMARIAAQKQRSLRGLIDRPLPAAGRQAADRTGLRPHTRKSCPAGRSKRTR